VGEATRLSPPATLRLFAKDRTTKMLRIQTRLPERYTSASPEQLHNWIGQAKTALGESLFILGITTSAMK